MNRINFLLCVLFLQSSALWGQVNVIEGRIVQANSNQPIPYANIYNKTLHKGTISNEDGFFRIPISGIKDSVRISFIGFEDTYVKLFADKNFYPIALKESGLTLSELTITPDDDPYLYFLVHECRNSRGKSQVESKAYYELKSFVDSTQVELVESYFNVDIEGYQIEDLKLKTGRVALIPHKTRFFASQESSRAIIMLNLMNSSGLFPTNPLELSKSKLKKNFYLSLHHKYVEDGGDSIYVINYRPKDRSGAFFNGTLWINKAHQQILKITLNCSNATIHPFLPLFPDDEISGVSFNITETFKLINNESVFNHIDFDYSVNYQSRTGKMWEKQYRVQTKAVLFAYDYTQLFILPYFTFTDPTIGDYRKLNAFPFNDFFWAYNDEYSINDSSNINSVFFSNPNAVTNRSLFKTNLISKGGLFEHPFVRWSTKRIYFKEILSDTSQQSPYPEVASRRYNLAVKIFMDYNSYNDSINIITSTIIDPYESFYYLPMDNNTHCFINMYFDLCEIQRRNLVAQLERVKSNPEEISKVYNQFLLDFEKQKDEYLKAVQRGTVESEMVKYNDYIWENLHINNVDFFQLFKDSN